MTTDAKQPYFSVAILCWNSNLTIKECLDALNAQTWQDIELLLVDNGSTEPISKAIISQYEKLSIQLFTLEHNAGFAGGNNFAVSHARGKYLVLLNADAFPRPDWLEKIHAGIQKYPHSFFASRQVMAGHPDRLDGAGDVYHVSGLAWRHLYNTQISTQDVHEREVFSACGAAAAYPLDEFRRLSGFDESYFSYIEDIDLSFRLRLVGYTCMYLPEATVDHVGSGSTHRRSDLAVFYGQRNLVWTFVKDMPGIFMWLLAPYHFLANLLQIILAIFRRQGRLVIRAKWEAIKQLSQVMRKRRNVQLTRRVPAYKLLLAMDWNPISPIIKLIHK